jgi:sigma-B regulation protein RsbU (phosphoserine phosphatase)
MARLQATLRALAPGVSSFAALGGSMNDIFERDGPGNRFATLFLFRLDGATPGRLRYLNAGHDPPFVVRAAGLDELPASAVPLGMFARAEYSEGAAELAPGDLLVVYSDGVIDARNPAGEEFGRDRLRALLPGLRGLDPAEAGRRLLLAVDDFLAGERPSDDLSLVLARRV